MSSGPATTSDPPAAEAGRDRRPPGLRERLTDANFASAIYGEVLVLSVLAALGDHEATAATVLVTVAGSQLVFWLAHAYAETLGSQLRSDDGRIDRESIGHVMEHEWPIVQAAGPAVVLLGLALLGAIDTSTAVDVAIALGVASLFGWGFAAGRRSRDTLGGQLVVGALSGAFGLVIVALKLVFH